MANYCDYEIHVKGTKKAALMLFASTPCLDYKDITHEEGSDHEYILWFEGCCKWSLDHYCKEQKNVQINLHEIAEDDIRNENLDVDYLELTMRQKSELLSLEILAHSWSEESEFNQLEHYKNGYFVGVEYDENVEAEFDFDF